MSPSTPALPVYVGHANPTGDISLFQMDPETGALTPVDTIATGSSSSFLAVDPTRRFLYATQNRSDQLSAFARDPATGRPTLLGRVPVPPGPGATEAGPSYLSVDATARFVLCANYRGHNTVVFAREGSGRLGRLVQSLSDGKHAHAVVLSPDNRFAFVPYLGSDRVMQYRFDDRTGALDAQRPALRRHGGRRGAAAPDVPPRRRARLPGQRARRARDGVRLRRPAGDAAAAAVPRLAPGLHGRAAGAPTSTSTPAAASSTSRTGPTTAWRCSTSTPPPARLTLGRPDAVGRPLAAQLLPRPGGAVPAGRPPGVRQPRHLRHRRPTAAGSTRFPTAPWQRLLPL